ncbi:hypothetical protein, conserved [Thermococcus onnurineus NA1]|uniref:Uncharacterized protein n=1 Tax=Thermococcus onnurineus (strain NA1) TaxID=523850 RepID=B6YVF7_THEON|nr:MULTISPECIES: hypothetical protein [Thermococcus]ACJ16235.1 hypothetical protein, conserved [Thermococcus onnurineus NA1]NJE47235.1 hypothetical protein [Thermococcus sp. GR7]NJE79028.1 hypothetical protein [Thermococcus sp. GR4]NJF22638.1 hypothetical protein [Thermococcus sp. GR5]
MDEEPPNSWLSRLFKPREKPALLEQKLSKEAYEDYRRLLMKARPEVDGSKLTIRLSNGTVELERDVLRVKAKNRKTAEKILRNLHHYNQPPSLWPAYGLSYSLKRKKGTIF